LPGERIAILDACVLVQAPLRDTLLRLAEAPALYQPRWSDENIAEMTRTLEIRIGLTAAKTAYLVREVRRHFADCWVTRFKPLVRKMTNSPRDRHVLAAAVRANAQSVVTFNKRHFPPAATSPWSINAVGPSAFLGGALGRRSRRRDGTTPRPPTERRLNLMPRAFKASDGRKEYYRCAMS